MTSKPSKQTGTDLPELSFLSGGGEMGARMRAFDWSSSPVGPAADIPAIALTGYAGAVDESKALNAGYELHFSKPINLSDLALTIAKLSGRSR